MRRAVVARTLELIGLAVIIVTALEAHFITISCFPIQMDMDSTQHCAQSAAYRAVALSPGNVGEKAAVLWTWPSLYPQGVYALSTLWMTFRPSGFHSAMESNAFFVVMLAVSAWAICRRAGGPLLGLIGAVLVVADPILLQTQHHFWLDMPLAATVVFSLACLLHCDGFGRVGRSLLVGFSVGFGMLTKFTFFWYLGAPLLYVAIGGLVREKPTRRQILILLGLLAAAGVSLKLLLNVAVAKNNFLIGSTTLASPFVLSMLAASLVICALWVLLTHLFLHGRPANISYALCVACVMVAPWVTANEWFLMMRWLPVAADIPTNAGNLVASLRIFATYIPLPILSLSVAGAFCAFTFPARREVTVPLVLAYVSGLLATMCILPITTRYTAPAGVILAMIAVCWLPRRWWLLLPALLLAVLYALVNLFGQLAVEMPAFAQHRNELTAASGWTRRLVADDRPDNRADVRSVATEVVEAMPPDVNSLVLLSTDRCADDYTMIWLMLQAELDWRGRLVSTRLLVPTRERLEERTVDQAVYARVHMLASWAGRPADNYPIAFDAATTAPQLVLVASDFPQPGEYLSRAFGKRFIRLPVEVPTGTLWRRAD